MAAPIDSPSERSIEIGGVGAVVRASRALWAPLAERLTGPTGPRPHTPAVRYDVTTDGPDLYGLERDHAGLRHNVDVAAVLDTLLADLADLVHRRRPQMVVARAAAVAVDRRGVVILGSPGSGTTALVNALVAAGATLLSDGLAVFDLFGRVHPVVVGGGDELDVDDEIAFASTEPVPVSLLVGTSHDPSVDWAPTEVTGVRAALGLLDHVVPTQQQAPATRALLGNLAPHVVQLRGPRSDAATVALDLIDRAEQRPVVNLPTPTADPDDAHATDGRRPTISAHHLLFDNFLDPAEHRRLLDHALAREAAFAPSEVLTEEPVEDRRELRRSRTVYDLDNIWGLFEQRLVGLLPHIRRELGIDWFDLGPFERQLTVHGNGDHFTLHIDNAGPDVASRVVSAVYYFNREPRRFSGGELRLFDTVDVGGRIEPADTFSEVTPSDNTLVVFPSEVPHEVRRVHVPGDAFADRRFTVVFWARRTPTPAELFVGDVDQLTGLQHALLPSLTSDGFRVVPTPPDVQHTLAEAFASRADAAFDEDADVNILPTGSPSFIDLGDLGRALHQDLKEMHEDWCGVALEPTFQYGLRVYREGQTLRRHSDRFETHVISSVVHVAADVDEPWPLVVEDRHGERHEVCLEPGEMLLYEGAKLPHSRPHPLRGRHYASLFLHYRPTDWDRTLARVCRQAGR